MKVIELLGKGSGILVGLLYLLIMQESDTFLWVWFLIVMATIGIPHGAIDHLLYHKNSGHENNLKKFIFLYLGIMLSYLLCWYYLPVTALILFIIMSAYHFGQSHFIRIKVVRHKELLYLTTGFYYLAAILFGDFEKTSEILITMVDIQFLKPFTIPLTIALLLSSATLAVIQPSSKKHFFLLELLILGLCLFYMPLLLAFITYFGFWHALPSLLEEYRNLTFEGGKNKALRFVKNLLPFSLISIFGIILILIIFNRWLSEKELTLLLFVIVSLISAPHIWIMNRFLENTSKQEAISF